MDLAGLVDLVLYVSIEGVEKFLAEAPAVLLTEFSNF
jgi:hypothetical protein